MKYKVDILYLILIFLNVSEMYRPLGVIIGLDSSSIISGASLSITILYLFINASELRNILRYKLVFYWILLVLVIPSLMMMLHCLSGYMNLEEFFYWLFYSAHFGLLMVGTVILVGRLNSRYFKFVYVLCVCSVVFGFIINIVNYDFVRQVLLFTGNAIYAQEDLFRIMGFFQHPNAAALSILSYFIIIMMFYPARENGRVKKVALIFMMFSLIAITGSRTMILLVVIIALMYLWTTIFRSVGNGTEVKLVIPILDIFGWFLVVVSLFILLPAFSSVDFGVNALNRVVERSRTIISLLSLSSGGDDSLSYRIEIIPVYFEFILKNPLLGVGPQFVTDRLADSTFANVSQNAFVEWSLKYGIGYAFFYLYVLYSTYRTASRLERCNSILSDGMKMFVALLVMVSFSINDLFWYRSIVVSVGVLLGYYCNVIKTGELRLKYSKDMIC